MQFRDLTLIAPIVTLLRAGGRLTAEGGGFWGGKKVRAEPPPTPKSELGGVSLFYNGYLA